MTDGRTLWYPEDARWIGWERTVVLGQEHGPAAIAVLTVLKCEAKLQDCGWKVKTGYHALAMAAFVPDVAAVRAIVARASEIGLLDDLDEGDWTFTCRISGMQASERKARDAARKHAERGPRTRSDTFGHVRTDADSSDAIGPRGEERREETAEAPPLGAVVEEPQTTVARDTEHERLSHLLASLIQHRDPNATVAPKSKAWLDAIRLLIDRDRRSPAEVERVIRWSQADPFWQANILSAPKLRAKFDQLHAKSLANGIAPAAIADAQVVEWLDRESEYEALRRHA